MTVDTHTRAITACVNAINTATTVTKAAAALIHWRDHHYPAWLADEQAAAIADGRAAEPGWNVTEHLPHGIYHAHFFAAERFGWSTLYEAAVAHDAARAA